MEEVQILDHQEFLKLKDKLKKYSLSKLKKVNLNFCSSLTGFNLLSFLSDDLELMEKVLQAGINVNHKNLKGMKAAYDIYPGNYPYQNLKLLYKYGVNIKQDDFSDNGSNSVLNLLEHLSKKHSILSYESEKELTKIQIFLLSKDINLIHPKDDYIDQIHILSLLTPDSLHYLLNYKDIPAFYLKNSLGHNLLHPVFFSSIYNHSEELLEKLLKLMTPEQVNNINIFGENALWNLKFLNYLKIELLIKYGLDIHHKDNTGFNIIENTSFQLSPSNLEKLIKQGVLLNENSVKEICIQTKESVIENGNQNTMTLYFH